MSYRRLSAHQIKPFRHQSTVYYISAKRHLNLQSITWYRLSIFSAHHHPVVQLYYYIMISDSYNASYSQTKIKYIFYFSGSGWIITNKILTTTATGAAGGNKEYIGPQLAHFLFLFFLTLGGTSARWMKGRRRTNVHYKMSTQKFEKK